MLPDFRRVRQRDYLLEITRAMTRELNLEVLLARILKIAVELLSGQAGLIALRKQRGGWEVNTSTGINDPFLRYLRPFLAQIQAREDPAQSELPQVFQVLEELTRVASSGLLHGVGLPLAAFGRVIGVIFIFRSYPDLFTTDERTILAAFADQAAIAVNNAQLFTQIRQEKQRIDALVDSVADGILILAPNGTIERCNPAFERLWGAPAAQIVGQNHANVIRFGRLSHGQTLEQAEAGGWPLGPEATLYVEGDLERPSSGKAAYELPLAARDKGNPLPVAMIYAPMMNPEGVLLNTIATVRDISNFRQAEELKSTFISVMSHELKTPVALIKGYVATLRREDAHWERAIVADSLQVIEEEADRLADMIENLLDASRLQAGGLKLNLAEVSLKTLAERNAERFRSQSTRHEFVVDFPADFPSVLGDAARLTQVFANLISNAIKYAPEGGEIRIGGQVLADQLVVCVTDQGLGIAPGDAPHIFDRFYRAVEASRTTKGAGLGLYLTRAIIEAHGGRIWVDTKFSGGARICFALPRE